MDQLGKQMRESMERTNRYRAVSALIQDLPAGEAGAWTTAERERWLAAVAAAVDWRVEVVRDDKKGDT